MRGHNTPAWWANLPEWLRWLLLFPALAVCAAVVGVVTPILFAWVNGAVPDWDWYRFLWNRILSPFMVTTAVISADAAVLFALAPRARRVLGWACFSPLFALSIIGVLLMVFRRLASWGAFGERLLPPAGVSGWEPDDWNELVRGLAWATSGVVIFRGYLERAREVENTARLDAAYAVVPSSPSTAAR